MDIYHIHVINYSDARSQHSHILTFTKLTIYFVSAVKSNFVGINILPWVRTCL